VASPKSVTTGQGASVAIDLTTGATGGPFTSAAIVTPPNPATGTATIQGLSVVFTPVVTFTGTTTFTFTLTNRFATSAPAQVSVTVQGRPDPSKDPSLDALVTAMTDSAERFISNETSNIGQRLGTLNGGGTGGTNAGGLSFTVNGRPLNLLKSDATRDLLARSFGQQYDAPGAPPQSGAVAPAQPQRLGIWADGTFGLGSHDGQLVRSGLNFGYTGVTAGVDYRFTDRLALGIAAGFAHDQNDLVTGHDQGTRANASDVALYGSLRLGRGGFLDVLAGTGTLHIDTRRFDPINSVMMTGSRSGNDAFGSLTFGQQFDSGTLHLAPYAGLSGDTATLKAFTETGPGIGAIAFGDQAVREMSAVVGIRGESRLVSRLGIVTPHFAVEYDRRLSATSIAPIWYADRPDTVFWVPANQIGSQPLNLELGGTLQLPGSFLFSVDYRSLIDRSAVQHLLRLGISTKL
jgi:large repetitive protein